MFPPQSRFLAQALACCALSAVSLAQTPCLDWNEAFGGSTSVSDTIYAAAYLDVGEGPSLYVGGSFAFAGSDAALRVARWTGTHWSPLGSGLMGVVRSLVAFDDGSGLALYAGGDFLGQVAKWDGTSWSMVGGGFTVSGFGTANVRALAVFDEGSGPALFATGSFAAAGGVPCNGIARWDGSAWSALGSGLAGPAPQGIALGVFDDGTGAALYAGGDFTSAGGVAASCIARWNGAQWS